MVASVEQEEVCEWNCFLKGFNVFCLVVFTIESAIRIIVHGIYKGRHAYLRNSWNRFDFVTIIASWLIYLAKWTFLGMMHENFAFAVSVMRTVRAMRYFASIRQIIATVANSLTMLLAVGGLMLFFLCIFSVVGMQLFAGVVNRRCLAPEDPQVTRPTLKPEPRNDTKLPILSTRLLG